MNSTAHPGDVRAVLFDLDGTLLDTAPDLVGALNHVRELEGLANAPVAEYRAYVSQGALGLLGAGMPAGDDGQMSRRRQQFLDFYALNSLRATVLFDGVERMLTELEASGLPWAIVTNKPAYLTGPILDAFGWASRSSCVVCGDTLARAKPYPDPVLHACELLGIKPAEALMVGDDPRDVQSAEAAGAWPVLAAYGYGAAAMMESATAPALIAHQPQDVLAMAGLGPVYRRP
jgi:phosphoglycolate phosphatase